MPRFVPRQRKQRHRQQANPVADTNAAEIAPLTKSEKEVRKEKLREELRAQNPKISAKKQKRLDKYIENKLKKEENIELLKKLSQSKVEVTGLQSSKELGKRKREDDKTPARTADAVEERNAPEWSSDESDDELKRTKAGATGKTTGATKQAAPNVMNGIGLKRPLELGPDGFPILKKRKRAPKPAPKAILNELPWEGFGSDGESKDDDNKAVDEPEDEKEEDSDSEEESEGAESQESDDSEDDDSDKEDEDEDEDEDVDEDENDDEGNEDEDTNGRIKPRQSAFKSWARQQINDVVGFKPTTGPITSESQPEIPKSAIPVRAPEEEPLPLELQVTKGNPYRKAFSVQVDRPGEVQKARLKLPVVGEEQKIMEAIHNNSAIVIWGATGSGKTTQLPQFLFESGYGNPESGNPGLIGVTQPRRVAAVSMAKRVGDELGQFSSQVSYQIRFESTVSSKTAIKFMTDGILIREIAEDFSLSKYSIIVIDEAHERSVNTDILIGMVSRIVDLRKAMSEEDPSVKPLKLVIMSATLRISDFTQNASLFRQGPPPLVQAEGRQYPVNVHFSRRTHRDYVEEAFRKVSRGHRKLPPGAILVFLTGQNEIRQLSKRLKQAFKPTQRGEATQAKVQISAKDAPLEAEDLEIGEVDISNTVADVDDDSDLEITGLDDPEDDEEFDVAGEGEEAMDASTKVHVLPLYSQLPTKEQLRVFEPPPEGSRLIVLATNVAETSLTIPGVRYVFDCGRAKEKQYDLKTGVQKFQIDWISKASANQRAGRA
ncbi:P-loop containing nucleoside triphosphate hydrolase protein, partial [Aspergillus oleicola]